MYRFDASYDSRTPSRYEIDYTPAGGFPCKGDAVLFSIDTFAPQVSCQGGTEEQSGLRSV